MKILVTGSTGMIGKPLVSKLLDAGHDVVGLARSAGRDPRAKHIKADLCDQKAIQSILGEIRFDRIIHLAGLAHATNTKDIPYQKYYQTNVEGARNIFQSAGDIPVLFISTVDVFGFTDGIVSVNTPLNPVSDYAKTKAIAEEECKRWCSRYDIFRFSPVYTPEIKRDIQKRYYLKYPNIAYLIGKGGEFEVLDVHLAVMKMAEWCVQEPDNQVHILKDEILLNAQHCILEEKKNGRAKHVLYLPRWAVTTSLFILKFLTGKNRYTYLFQKAVHPLRTAWL